MSVQLKKSLIPETAGKALECNVIQGGGYRITVLTPQLFRVERGSAFCDLPTQRVWFRNTPKVEFTTSKSGAVLTVKTQKVTLIFNEKSGKVRFLGLSQRGNLRGTTRTLDGTFGAVRLGKGIIAKGGLAVMDDGKSLVIKQGGMIGARPNAPASDKYYFAHGRDYLAALKDFYTVCGRTPEVPRYALGVWWSRYRAYTQQEYLDLMRRFKQEDIPITVATVDMDWHYTDLNKKFGENYPGRSWSDNPCTGGWTGYTWNDELFPDYRAFLKELNGMGLAVTLNLHPADGVRWHEVMYPEMAKALGIDPATKQPVKMDFSNPAWINAYFDIVHKPYEREGVTFWWIDWQQGKRCSVPGLDPLWALNHYHYLDNGLTLSRYAGLGSHRYPLGFSGDTAINWRVLNFQPYFTANAANAGYAWWSHDIGGHHLGFKDDELYIRWLQFGVFSPIMRLHSTSHDLLAKEPWRFNDSVCQTAKKWLRLRHSLIPYLEQLSQRHSGTGAPLCEPVYYRYPDEPLAYKYRNTYFFGEKLLVAPITSKTNSKLGMASAEVWLPEGRWTDIFTGRVYQGGRVHTMWRGLSSIPVLAAEGAEIPVEGGGFLEIPATPQKPFKQHVIDILTMWQARNLKKMKAYAGLKRVDDEAALKKLIRKKRLPKTVKSAIFEGYI